MNGMGDDRQARAAGTRPAKSFMRTRGRQTLTGVRLARSESAWSDRVRTTLLHNGGKDTCAFIELLVIGLAGKAGRRRWQAPFAAL